MTGVMVMPPNSGPDYPAQAQTAKDMRPDYNWKPAHQGHDVVPVPVGAPYQPQPPAYHRV